MMDRYYSPPRSDMETCLTLTYSSRGILKDRGMELKEWDIAILPSTDILKLLWLNCMVKK